MRLIDADVLEPDADYDDGEYWAVSIAQIQNAPTIEERKTGKWMRHAIGHENVPWGFDCSACNKWFVIGEDTADQYNFCPNCGAKMEGEQHG